MIYLKQYDNGYGLEDTLSDENGALDLSTASVTFYMGAHEIPAQITDAVNGQILVSFTSVHTATPGKMRAEYRVRYNDGRVETYPSRNYIDIIIMKSVGGNTNG